MPVSSTSTLAQVQAAYDDNAPPFASVAQASEFIRACTILIRRVPVEHGDQFGSMKHDIDSIRKERETAQAWLEANSGSAVGTGASSSISSPIIRASFRNFRL
jgi:hypothetical protein